ncbi:YbaK/aminoacyl-tRNA synthetase-associated domain-containing protein [Rhynchospora pubera]|uniref:YbaK/aminoacyl-tRNA synthetase-associated domain-containing protein n=1 Tax=Rhynchospora pubera TaxID=906938 RepID=A0AAV8H263_9POAL|nr:YbaK/aminoacyl-tRNA synthetase-associated domain-containing protein [Rhynchospora pubera]
MTLADLEAKQIKLLHRIAQLELRLAASSISSSKGCGEDAAESMETRLSKILLARGVNDFAWKRVPSDYYDQSLEDRRQILNAPRVEQLCKSIVMVNTQASEDITDCSNPKNSKYYVVVVQYMARLNAESIKNFLYALNDRKVPKKRFNMRLAPEDESLELTGFIHNAVTCIGMQTDIPVIIDEAITKLEEDYFWLGGGEVDLKLGMKTSQFLSAFKPFVVKCS